MIFTGQLPYDTFLTLLAAAKKLKENEWKTHSAERVPNLTAAIKMAEDGQVEE